MVFEVFICLLFAGACLVQVFFLLYFIHPLHKNTPPVSNSCLPLSILVVGRNERTNLERLLPRLANQQYHDFDIHLVDDASEDGTPEMVRELMSRFPLIYLHVLPGHSGKKQALETGLQFLDRELVLLTDADCLPASEKWISLMVEALSPGSDAVLGYSPYVMQEGRLNEVIRLETAYTAALYFGFAQKNLAYMGVGRNLLYRRKALVNAFRPDAHQGLKSGDDDLTIQELTRKGRLNYRFDPPSWVYSRPEKSWKAWLDQKKRHVGTARHYRPLHQVLLLMWYGSLTGTWIFGLLAAFSFPLILLLWIGFKGIGFLLILRPMLLSFGVPLPFRKWLSAEGIYVGVLLYLLPFSTFKKWDKW